MNFKALPIITPTPTPTPIPSITIEGHVRLENPVGPGVPDVRIYQSSGSYLQNSADALGQLVAVTNEAGYYRGTISQMDGSDVVWIWAVKKGYHFEPSFYRIKISYNSLLQTYDFIAFPIRIIPVPEEVPREIPQTSIR